MLFAVIAKEHPESEVKTLNYAPGPLDTDMVRTPPGHPPFVLCHCVFHRAPSTLVFLASRDAMRISRLGVWSFIHWVCRARLRPFTVRIGSSCSIVFVYLPCHRTANTPSSSFVANRNSRHAHGRRTARVLRQDENRGNPPLVRAVRNQTGKRFLEFLRAACLHCQCVTAYFEQGSWKE